MQQSPYVTEAESQKQHSDSPLCNSLRIFHSKMQFGVELALLRTPPPLQGGREEQVASCRDEKRDDALTVPLRLMQYICC